ncbi:MAG: response regulator [Pseudomonadota bacterium]
MTKTPKILILEDDPEFGALVSDSLQRAGYDTSLFSDVSKAIGVFESEDFDLVVADLIIKKEGVITSEGGLILTWRIREIAESKGITVPVIAMSGSVHHLGMQHALDTARHMGADEVMAKPFSPQDLLERVEKVLAGHQD